jgi:hypothetical protein
MKEVSIAILGTVLVLLSLMSLIIGDPTPGASWTTAESREHLSEIGLRYVLSR